MTRKVQVVLTKQIPNLGNAGDLKAVPVGHYRNYLQPKGLAMIATESILADIEKKIAADDRAKLEEKAKAQAMATALSTIGKFIIKKKVGEEVHKQQHNLDGTLQEVRELLDQALLEERKQLARDAMMDDGIQLVTISGKAGTGKTLLALAQ